MSWAETIALADENGDLIGIQNPFQVDGDSVHAIDLDITNSSIGTFSGVAADLKTLFNDYDVEIEDISASNPKTFTLRFERPISNSQIGIGSKTGDFSNVKISLKDLSGTIRQVVDDSANSTKYTSNVYQFTQTVFIEAFIEFYTADPVKIVGLFIPKIQPRSISSIEGHLSADNSSAAILGVGGVFTGTAERVLNYGIILVSVFADQASATDGLVIEQSTDGTNWDHSDEYTIAANTGKTFSLQPAAIFYRVVYTNGGVAQTAFRLQTQLKPVYVKPSSHRVADSVSNQDDAELIKAVITGENPSGDFVNFEATAGGNFKVSIEEYETGAAPWGTDLEGGGKISVGTAAVEVTFSGTPTKAILITADRDNTGILYVGKSNVTTAGVNAFTFLEVGDSIEIDYEDSANAIYVVASEASQNFWKGAIL